MRNKICSLPYINSIAENVLAVKEDELQALYENLRSCDIIIPIASGRSECAINIPLSQLVAMKKKNEIMLIYPKGPVFPWGSFNEFSSILEEKYRNERILFLFNSGSGTTLYSSTIAHDLNKYMEERKPKNFKICAITSNPDSLIGKIAKEHGVVLQLKGREFLESEEYKKAGIMGDKFELASCFLFQTIVKTLYYDFGPEMIYKFAEDEFVKLGKMIDDMLTSPFYTKAIDILETRCDVFGNARGTGEEVTKSLLIRLFHVKKAIGDDVYIDNSPMPRAGDIQFSVSFSGSTSTVVEASRRFKELGGYQFSIIANKETPLEKVSDCTLILPENVKPGEPRMFYMWALFCSSPFPIGLIERLRERGINLTPEILKYHHSVTG